MDDKGKLRRDRTSQAEVLLLLKGLCPKPRRFYEAMFTRHLNFLMH